MTKRTTFLCTTLLLAGCVGDELSSDNESDVEQHASGSFQDNGAKKRWPGGVRPIYYYIDLDGHHPDKLQPGCDHSLNKSLDDDDVNPANGIPDVQETIEAGLALLESQTPVRFEALGHVPTSADSKFVLIFTQGDFGNPHGDEVPGMNGWKPNDYQGCVYLVEGKNKASTVQHEVGHDLGLIHEQGRSDRDWFVDVDDDPAVNPNSCIQAGKFGNFNPTSLQTMLTPYDYQSIMHYSTTSFCDTDRDACVTVPSCNNDGDTSDCICKRPTILKAGCTNHVADASDPDCTDVDGKEIGSSNDLSIHDINAIYRMYEPSLGSDETNDEFGAAMAKGDFDGDGYDDLAVGAPGEAPGSDPASGAVMIYKGTEGGLVSWTYVRVSDFGVSAVAGDRFGAALAAGDFDNDGDDELIVGAPGYNGGAGAVFQFNGAHAAGNRVGLKVGIVYYDPTPASGGSSGANRFGSSVALGKVNGTDLAIVAGAPNAARITTRSGLAFVHTHGTSSTSWTRLAPDISYVAGTQFGASVSIGDLTANNSGGLAVGAPSATFISAGRVFVYSGTLATLGVIANSPSAVGDRFGAAVDIGHFLISSVGKDYLMVGAPNAGTGGNVTMWNTTTSVTLMKTFTAADVSLTPAIGQQFGTSLAHGAIDSTIFADDLVIGIPGHSSNQGAIGLLRSTNGTSVVGWTSRTEKDDGFPRQANDRFGTSVAAGLFGDVDNDLFNANDYSADVAAGAPGRKPNNVTGAGTFQWFFGQDGGSQPVFQAGLDQAASSPE